MGLFFVYILKSSVCLAIFYLFYRLLLARETFHRFNRFSLLGILLLWIVGVVHNLGQTVEVGEEQVGALVGGEAAAEADHQGVGRDALDDGHHLGGVALVAEPLLCELP